MKEDVKYAKHVVTQNVHKLMKNKKLYKINNNSEHSYLYIDRNNGYLLGGKLNGIQPRLSNEYREILERFKTRTSWYIGSMSSNYCKSYVKSLSLTKILLYKKDFKKIKII